MERSLYVREGAVPQSGNWVLVYGLPPRYKEERLMQLLAGFGQVQEIDMGMGATNWVRVRFSTQLAAANAIACGVSYLERTVLVGFAPYEGTTAGDAETSLEPLPLPVDARRDKGVPPARRSGWERIKDIMC